MAKPEFKFVGTSPARMGGVDRVIGKGVYGIDLMLKDQLHGAILRSQYAHAKIVSIDTSEAKKVPGVHAVVTAADAPDVRYGRSYIDRYILARHKVRFMGDPVAAVAAESPAIAKQALKKIKVVYEPLPVALDPEEATKPDAPTLHDDMPLPKTFPADAKLKNICGHTVVHVGDPDKAMAEADVVVDEVYETKMIHPQYLEPRIAAAQMEPNGRLTVWANAQAPFPCARRWRKMLGMPLNNVRVISADLGGGFGGKGSGITSGAAIEPICGLLGDQSQAAGNDRPRQGRGNDFHDHSFRRANVHQDRREKRRHHRRPHRQSILRRRRLLRLRRPGRRPLHQHARRLVFDAQLPHRRLHRLHQQTGLRPSARSRRTASRLRRRVAHGLHRRQAGHGSDGIPPEEYAAKPATRSSACPSCGTFRW